MLANNNHNNIAKEILPLHRGYFDQERLELSNLSLRSAIWMNFKGTKSGICQSCMKQRYAQLLAVILDVNSPVRLVLKSRLN